MVMLCKSEEAVSHKTAKYETLRVPRSTKTTGGWLKESPSEATAGAHLSALSLASRHVEGS